MTSVLLRIHHDASLKRPGSGSCPVSFALHLLHSLVSSKSSPAFFTRSVSGWYQVLSVRQRHGGGAKDKMSYMACSSGFLTPALRQKEPLLLIRSSESYLQTRWQSLSTYTHARTHTHLHTHSRLQVNRAVRLFSGGETEAQCVSACSAEHLIAVMNMRRWWLEENLRANRIKQGVALYTCIIIPLQNISSCFTQLSSPSWLQLLAAVTCYIKLEFIRWTTTGLCIKDL